MFSDVNTGIQRVVRNVLRYAPEIAGQYGFDVVPVILENGRFIVADLSVVLSDKQRQRLDACSKRWLCRRRSKPHGGRCPCGT